MNFSSHNGSVLTFRDSNRFGLSENSANMARHFAICQKTSARLEYRLAANTFKSSDKATAGSPE